jgi:hypothetical protein
MLKAWHTHGNTPHGGADFYPLLAETSQEAHPSPLVHREFLGGTLEKRVHVRALPVLIVETTAAGDALNGALTVGGCPQGYTARRKGHHGP